MIVKLVNGESEDIFPCDHFNKTPLTGSKVQAEMGLPGEPGFMIRLSGVGPKKEQKVFQMPRDAQECFVMNDQGDTIQIVRWPDTKGGK